MLYSAGSGGKRVHVVLSVMRMNLQSQNYSIFSKQS